MSRVTPGAPPEVLPQPSGLEQYRPTHDVAVGDDTFSWEDEMVEIRVAVADPASAHGLLQRLAALFDRSAVSFDSARSEVRVRSEWESRSVVEVIDLVQSWLAADGVESAELSVGDRSYTLTGPTLTGPSLVAR